MRKRKEAVRKGFTMVELMAVLIIIGLLATVVAPKVLKHIEKGKVTTTKANLRILHSAVMHFYMDTQRFPTEEEGLQILVESMGDIEGYDLDGYLEQTAIPKDGWKNEFIYDPFPESGKQFEIRSSGPDGEEGTEDDLLSTDAD
jgi:general secretion pathway protein G